MADIWKGPTVRARLAIGATGVVVLLVSAFLHNDTAYAIAALVVGSGLVVIGALAPHIRSAKLGAKGAEVEMHESREREAAARAAGDDVPVDLVVEGIASADEVPPAPSHEDDEVIGTLNYIAGNVALKAIFESATAAGEPLEGCYLRLYLLDEDEDLLKAVAGIPHSSAATAWRVGQGATGAAYESGEYVLASGDTAWDDTYDLTEEEQERFRSLAAVGAMPVYGGTGQVIGVITASTRSQVNRLVTEEGEQALVLTALLVSRVLIELFQWF